MQQLDTGTDGKRVPMKVLVVIGVLAALAVAFLWPG